MTKHEPDSIFSAESDPTSAVSSRFKDSVKSITARSHRIDTLVRKYLNIYRDTEYGRIRRRKKYARGYFKYPLTMIDRWAALNTEDSNFSYDLTHRNTLDLVGMLCVVTGCTTDQIKSFIQELEEDQSLRNHISVYYSANENLKDAKVSYGRRTGWYVLARALKPKVVVETGVELGVGACVLSAAIIKNASEGYNGRYIGTELTGVMSHLYTEPYNRVGEILSGDSVSTLEQLEVEIDFFVNDSDHRAEYERAEYTAIANRLAQHSLILSDNSHATSSLAEFSFEHDRPFLFFREEPSRHWYPGAGIGISPSRVPLDLNREL